MTLDARFDDLDRRALPGGLTLLIAGDRRSRMLGLARLDDLPADHALLFERCRSIQTAGMRFALDLVWLDRDSAVVRVDAAVGPRRLRTCMAARSRRRGGGAGGGGAVLGGAWGRRPAPRRGRPLRGGARRRLLRRDRDRELAARPRPGHEPLRQRGLRAGGDRSRRDRHELPRIGAGRSQSGLDPRPYLLALAVGRHEHRAQPRGPALGVDRAVVRPAAGAVVLPVAAQLDRHGRADGAGVDALGEPQIGLEHVRADGAGHRPNATWSRRRGLPPGAPAGRAASA